MDDDNICRNCGVTVLGTTDFEEPTTHARFVAGACVNCGRFVIEPDGTLVLFDRKRAARDTD